MTHPRTPWLPTPITAPTAANRPVTASRAAQVSG
jgi:hypothetical protein